MFTPIYHTIEEYKAIGPSYKGKISAVRYIEISTRNSFSFSGSFSKNSLVCGVCWLWTVVICLMICSSSASLRILLAGGSPTICPRLRERSSCCSRFTSSMSRVFFSWVYRPVFIAVEIKPACKIVCKWLCDEQWFSRANETIVIPKLNSH